MYGPFVSRPGRRGWLRHQSGFHFDLQWGQTRQKIGKKKGWKNNNPKSSLRNGVSPEPQNLQKDFLNLKNRTDKNKLKFYHMSSRKNTRFTCQITYYIQFYFCSQQFSHQKWSFCWWMVILNWLLWFLVNWKYDKNS